ncbi:ASCH domain-containing protein [Cupriavidus basilensis]|uniref:ASCH domain-containing protein n=1 Tax=Cupriavidus basilensis TaxID=68895 RepID=UPI0020A6AF04|nr:ASCH domain-containing protein [Cupriavidus basilensis]MCP3024537.1 ASCH domain-containing protein [Cupriavidus basilensis]
MRVILSIKPEYAEKILNGSKRFEFRKTGFGVDGVTSVLIYATRPIGKVVGEFEIEKVYVDSPSSIWDKTKRFAGIAKSFFDEYYKNRDVAVAIAVGKVQRYDAPVDLQAFGADLTAPQSFRYLRGDTPTPQLQLPL